MYQATTALEDSTVLLSSSKAKELGVGAGDTVVLIGRRRAASYGIVQIASKKKAKFTSCTLSANLAANLRLRQDDKVKVVPLTKTKESDDDEGNRSGDLVLLDNDKPIKVTAVTFSPIEDSLVALESNEGGDELTDEEIKERFIDPYLTTDGAMIKQGHALKLRDENGKALDFMVSFVELKGSAAKSEKEGRYLGSKSNTGH